MPPALRRFMQPFCGSAPLGRLDFFTSSAAAALAFVALAMLLIMVSGNLLLSDVGFIVGSIFLTILLFLACTASPFTLIFFYLISSPLMWLSPPELPAEAALALTLLCFVLLLATILRLFNLAMRRRRDAGRSALNYFAFSGIAIAFTAALHISYVPVILILIGYGISLTLQCFMLLPPTKNPPPPSA